jgi:hypothetical protein
VKNRKCQLLNKKQSGKKLASLAGKALVKSKDKTKKSLAASVLTQAKPRCLVISSHYNRKTK